MIWTAGHGIGHAQPREVLAMERDLVATEQRGPGSTRRILPAMLLWSGLMVCVLEGFGQQLALWRLLTLKGLWGPPPLALSDQAVYKRLQTGGTTVLERLFAQI